MSHVLVLSPSYQAMEIVPWERAITLWWEKKVEIVESSDKTVRSINFEMKMPSIIRFLKADSSKRRAVRFSRENVLSRDNYSCQYCGDKVSRDNFTYDHVIPRSQGGQTTWANVVISCMDCNQRKGGRTPVQANMRLLSVPVKPKKLSQTVKFCLTWNDTYPDSWKNWLTDVKYWHSSLESDN
jgi:5-methylcytosine-specific restriction endonuclease McrA